MGKMKFRTADQRLTDNNDGKAENADKNSLKKHGGSFHSQCVPAEDKGWKEICAGGFR